MSKIVKFDPKKRKRRKWTRAKDYGVPRPPKKPKTAKAGRWKRLAEWRPIILLVALVTIIVFFEDPRWEPPGFLQTEPESIDSHFTQCGPGGSSNCVIDGDTFKIGNRRIRVVGIDTAEKKSACPAESAKANYATDVLMDWLNRGPFQMTARRDDPTDRYGRELRIVKRIDADGAESRLAAYMIAQGFARPYRGGFRSGWC